MVTIAEFGAVDLRVGRIIEVQDLEAARKPMYQTKIDIGELGVKNIAMGLKAYYTKEELMGKLVIVVCNLDPKNVAGFVSEGMVLAAQDGERVSLVAPDKDLAPGSKVA
jgi:export-related chaperone CsaA